MLHKCEKAISLILLEKTAFSAIGMNSEVKLQAASQGARRRKLNGNLLALFGNPVAIIRQIGRIQLQVQVVGLHLPQVEAGGKISGKMLVQTRAVFHDCAAAIPQRRTDPGASPPASVEEVGGSGVCLIECGLDALTRLKRFVAGKSSGYRAVEICAGNGILHSRAYPQPLQIADI